MIKPPVHLDIRYRYIFKTDAFVGNKYFTVSLFTVVPRAQKKKIKRAAGSPAASTQLALCLRLAFDV
jgi:hypothetical protein